MSRRSIPKAGACGHEHEGMPWFGSAAEPTLGVAQPEP
jgi:hypothetical protein